MKAIVACLLYLGASSAFSWDTDTSTASTTCACGWVNRNRIVGGREVQRNEYPLMVALEQGRGRQFCGGTILTPWHVLTAAHCTFGTPASQIQINAGAHNIGERSVAFHRVARIIEHERYDNNRTVNDIALLVLQTPITFNQNIGPACLPNRRLSLVGQRIRALGWGRLATNGRTSPTLQEVDLPVIPMSQCQRSWGYSPLRGPFEATNLCTFERNQDTCQGDSGGPLIWLDPDTNRFTIAALVSYGAECGGNLPAVNTDVSAYRDWINSNIQASVPGARACTRA